MLSFYERHKLTNIFVLNLLYSGFLSGQKLITILQYSKNTKESEKVIISINCPLGLGQNSFKNQQVCNCVLFKGTLQLFVWNF